MGLPDRIIYQDDRYPFIILAPIGKKNKSVRSIGHKFERGLLSRLNDTIKEQAEQMNIDISEIQHYLGVTGDAILPVTVQKEEKIYPHLLKPELFLWRTLPNEHGLPLKEEYLYDVEFTHLSAEQLKSHITKVLEDYAFLAKISRHPRDYWLDLMAQAFHKHPIVELNHRKQKVIDAVEEMNQSALLSVLKYPEDVAYWRHRVEIVMRPYRELPDAWTAGSGSCSHEKSLQFSSDSQTIECHCEVCDFNLYYHVDQDRVSFTENHDVERAKKRMVTIEKQFNDIAEQNAKLMDQLFQIRSLKRQLMTAEKTLEESLDIVKQINRYELNGVYLEDHPILNMYAQLKDVSIPSRKISSPLLWMADVQLEDVSVLKRVGEWTEEMPGNVYPLTNRMLEELKETLDDVRYGEEDVILTIKGHALTYAKVQQILDLIHYYGTEYPAHTLVQVLAGKATNKLRTLKLHETRWFGLLSDWPEKNIQKLFNQLEKQGWLMKQQRGYSVSDFAEEVM
ncbi:hypothetical protein EQV77_07765 [Halobacillus fulvus]|nr:hypothetical protein EQV77_07765 [Halobacillus fulvus]